MEDVFDLKDKLLFGSADIWVVIAEYYDDTKVVGAYSLEEIANRMVHKYEKHLKNEDPEGFVYLRVQKLTLNENLQV